MIDPEAWQPVGGVTLEPNADHAVREPQGSAAITAGPGAGKTELLAQRADFLLRTGKTRYPYRILAISFKRDASRNLKARVRLRCGPALAHRLDSHTFHAFGKGLIDRFRGALTGRDALNADYTIGQQRYQGSQITFADMVPLGLQIIEGSAVARNAVRQTYSHVFLDEFQDCNSSQYRLIKAAFLGTGIPITAVGDTKQRIMGWAGALEGIIETFALDFGARRLNLYQNFRSKPRLRRMQNAMVRVMEPGAAVDDAATSGDEGEIQVLAFSDADAEAEAIATAVLTWIEQEQIPPAEIAILVRQQIDYYGAPLMRALESRSIPYRNEQDLQDLSAEPLARLIVDYLTVVIGEREPDAYARLMDTLSDLDPANSGAGSAPWSATLVRVRAEALSQNVDNIGALEALGERFIDECGLERLRGLSPEYAQGERLLEVVAQVYERVDQFLAKGVTALEALARFSEDQAVRILTIHKSKGLEFDSVVVLGVEQETFWGEAGAARAEYFVAISRAKRRLVLTTAETRTRPQGAPARWNVARTPHAEFLGYSARP